MFSVSYHLLALDVLKNHTESGAIFTEVSDDSAGALDDLAGVTLSVDLAETAPLAIEAGATVLVMGSYIFSADDMGARVKEIKAL